MYNVWTSFILKFSSQKVIYGNKIPLCPNVMQKFSRTLIHETYPRKNYSTFIVVFPLPPHRWSIHWRIVKSRVIDDDFCNIIGNMWLVYLFENSNIGKISTYFRVFRWEMNLMKRDVVGFRDVLFFITCYSFSLFLILIERLVYNNSKYLSYCVTARIILITVSYTYFIVFTTMSRWWLIY